MKTNKILFVTIVGLIIIILTQLFLSSNQTCVNIYCDTTCKPSNGERCQKTNVPSNELNPEDIMMYYKIDDNCNFQTLAFNIKNELTRYTILGRFDSKKINDTQYEINKLEVKYYNIFDDEGKEYMVEKVEISKESNINNLVVDLTIKEGSGTDGSIDAAFIGNLNEPLIVDINSSIHFEIKHVDNKVVPAGGYECNGKIIGGGG